MLSFKLADDFIDSYATQKVDWGYTDAGGNSLGEITFLRTYSRIKEDGTKERWHEVCRRVIEWMFSEQKNHCKSTRLPWNDHKAQRSAQDAYERMFSFKWTPPGRGLWMAGTPLVYEQRNSAALQNCAFVSTADMTKIDPAGPFCFLMEASMLGVGVGFDDKGADKEFMIYEPGSIVQQFVIPDTREGWVDSVRFLLESYLMPSKRQVEFDYSLVRPEGAPIKTFGGVAAGPGPLMSLHRLIRKQFDGRSGAYLTRIDIADIGNLIGKCVVSGNVRRSAELLIGRIDDKDFINLKNPESFPERNFWTSDENDPRERGWGHLSNNSVEASVGSNYDHLVEAIALNGEPGIIWMDVSRDFGRLLDPKNGKDWRIAGYNPCAEQSLESFEMCTLVETYLNRHDSLEDFQRTLKYAYLYAKTVTLLPTHWERTNAIMQRNRRIGCSVSGVANFVDNRGMTELRTWLNQGYATVQRYDDVYSEWLCIRPSIKMTTVKPSGTVSILAGESPGVHWAPGGEYFNRAIRLAKNNALVPLLRAAGYVVEPDVTDQETTVVCYFPIHALAKRAEGDVSIFEKANLAVVAQRYWSDNSVSVTLSFDPETEAKHIGTVLHMHEGQLKTVSFLPKGNKVYPQQPYTQITEDEWTEASMSLFKIDLSPIYAGENATEAVGEEYCTTDSCIIKEETAAIESAYLALQNMQN